MLNIYYIVTDYIYFLQTLSRMIVFIRRIFHAQYNLSAISSYHRDINSSDSVMRAQRINSSGCLNIFATRGHPISVRYGLMPSE